MTDFANHTCGTNFYQLSDLYGQALLLAAPASSKNSGNEPISEPLNRGVELITPFANTLNPVEALQRLNNGCSNCLLIDKGRQRLQYGIGEGGWRQEVEKKSHPGPILYGGALESWFLTVPSPSVEVGLGTRYEGSYYGALFLGGVGILGPRIGGFIFMTPFKVSENYAFGPAYQLEKLWSWDYTKTSAARGFGVTVTKKSGEYFSASYITDGSNPSDSIVSHQILLRYGIRYFFPD